ncbi:hypothetical protein [Constantimarinum furrinae]|nr:hypothetical protein [Constantimarinum furrinae]
MGFLFRPTEESSLSEEWEKLKTTVTDRVVCIFNSGTKGTIDKGN